MEAQAEMASAVLGKQYGASHRYDNTKTKQEEDLMKALRKQKGFSRRVLGKKVGTSAKTVKLWEQGKGMPGIRTVMKLARALSVDYIELIDCMSRCQTIS